jgi:hypothetical protein
MNFLRIVLLTIAMAVVWAATDCVAAPTSPTQVTVWTGGDDGLTLKLSEAINTAFKESPLFVLDKSDSASAMSVAITTNVAWKRIGRRTKVTANIQIAKRTPDAPLVTATVTCWEDDLGGCARTVIKLATPLR